jgi:hypothetical protein
MIRNYFPSHKPELPGLPFPPPGRGPNADVRELLLGIQDRAFDMNNQLYYPKQDALPAEFALPNGTVPPTWVPGERARLATFYIRSCSAVASAQRNRFSCDREDDLMYLDC